LPLITTVFMHGNTHTATHRIEYRSVISGDVEADTCSALPESIRAFCQLIISSQGYENEQPISLYTAEVHSTYRYSGNLQ